MNISRKPSAERGRGEVSGLGIVRNHGWAEAAKGGCGPGLLQGVLLQKVVAV